MYWYFIITFFIRSSFLIDFILQTLPFHLTNESIQLFYLNVVCFSFVCYNICFNICYTEAGIIKCREVDAFISISRPRSRDGESMKTLKSYHNILFSPRHSLSREEIEMCATEAILAVLMVCIIHIDEPNRIGIWSPPTVPFLSTPIHFEISLTVVKNSHPSQRAMKKTFIKTQSLAYHMYNVADTYHKPQSWSISCPAIFFFIARSQLKKKK